MIALLLAAPRLLALDGFVLAEHRNGSWAAVEPPAARLVRAGRLTWSPASLSRMPAPPITAGVSSEEAGYVGLYVQSEGMTGVYLSGTRPRRPRRIELLPPSDATYRGVLRRWLDRRGMPKSPARIARIARTDLDGDGTKEVLIEARSRDDMPLVGFDAPSNDVDYSLVLLRALRDGRVVELPLRFSRGNGPQGSADESKLRAIADFDADGRMDLLLGYRAWEAFGGELVAYRKGYARTLLVHGAAL